jgi:hypothetical protein
VFQDPKVLLGVVFVSHPSGEDLQYFIDSFRQPLFQLSAWPLLLDRLELFSQLSKGLVVVLLQGLEAGLKRLDLLRQVPYWRRHVSYYLLEHCVSI